MCLEFFVSDIRQELKYNIPTDNRFTALSKSNTKNDTDDQIDVENANSASQMQKTPKGDKQSILIWDSQVRNILKNFCPDSKRKTVHCYPNINTENAATNTSGILGAVDKSDKDATVIVNIGSYDVLNCQTKHIKENMKILIKELADRRANRNIKIAEITPHLYNKGLNKKIKIVNNYVKSLCEIGQLGLIEFWDKFENRIDLYVKDGSQLNKKGKAKLGNILTENCPNDFLE